MQVLDVHAAFLSNYEVLALLKDNVKAQDKALRTFQGSVPTKFRSPTYKAVKGKPYLDYDQALGNIVPDNVRTLQVETLAYLIQPDLPCMKQNPTNIRRILSAIDKVPTLEEAEDARGSNALTKIEKLMMINLAPLKLVDLAVIIEELDNRYSEDAQAQFLSIFRDELGGLDQVQTGMQEDGVHEAMEAVLDEAEELQNAEVEHNEQVSKSIEDTYADEDDYDESRIMPDEENDLIDEGMGDGGRDAEIKEIDEIGDGE